MTYTTPWTAQFSMLMAGKIFSRSVSSSPEFDDEDEGDQNGRPKKKKYRYRWPDEIHDDVLARLLALNRQCALEEGQLLAVRAIFEASLKTELKTTGTRKEISGRSSMQAR